MEVKHGPPIDRFEPGDLSPLLRACVELNHLKQLYRQGWLRRGVDRERCESVAEHSFGVALLALLVADLHFPELDRERLLRMALVHDAGEVHAGDITPADGVDAEEKRRREADSVRRVLGGLPRGEEYVALWHEYEQGASAEARLLRQLDKLEMALQALVYEREGASNLGEFFETVERDLRNGELRAVLEELRRLRPEH